MEDDSSSSSDVEAVEVTEEKPIMNLFRRLIDKTVKAILSNAQITHLIQQEFNIDCNELHPLQLNIYIDIMKKFLKDWPQWDEFDRIINKHKANNDNEGITQLLDTKHKELKDYLKTMLDQAKILSDKAVENVENELKEKRAAAKGDPDASRDVVMEVQCTRPRLNNLFFKYPHPEQNESIFNTEDLQSRRITTSPPTYQSILNWWDVTIQLNLNRIVLKRETAHEFKRVLVNRKNREVTSFDTLDTRLQENLGMKKYYRHSKENVLKCLEGLKSLCQKTNMKTDLEVILWFLRDDIKNSRDKIAVPGSYRKYMNKHPYVRYSSVDVSKENKMNSSKYDLALEETISPMYRFTISKLEPNLPVSSEPNTSIENVFKHKVSVKCEACDIKFEGIGLLKNLQQHYWSSHTNEQDWECTKCKKQFKMAALSGSRWYHDCGI